GALGEAAAAASCVRTASSRSLVANDADKLARRDTDHSQDAAGDSSYSPARAHRLCKLADDHPSDDVTLVVAYDAGGNVDTPARALGQCFEDERGQSVMVKNRPGSAGAMAPAMWPTRTLMADDAQRHPGALPHGRSSRSLLGCGDLNLYRQPAAGAQHPADQRVRPDSASTHRLHAPLRRRTRLLRGLQRQQPAL